MKAGDVKVRYRGSDAILPRRVVVFVWAAPVGWQAVYSLPIPDRVKSKKTGLQKWCKMAKARWEAIRMLEA